MRAGLLRHQIQIQYKNVTGKDAYGGEQFTWTNLATVWAEVEPLKLTNYIAAKAAQVDVTLRVSMRYLANVTADMRVYWSGAGYPIESVVNVRGRSKELELICSGPSQAT